MMPEKINKEIAQVLKNAADFESKGRIKEAIVEYERAIKLNPADGNLYNHLGDLHIKVNKIKEAVDAYMKGIETFRNDNFYRNALGICKKVLRYDPGNLEINIVIAKLLVELDEKSDASIYLFSYIERQMAAGNKKEVLQAMEYLKELKLGDKRFSDKMAQIYEKVGESKLATAVKTEPEKPLSEPKPSKPAAEFHDIHEIHEMPVSSLLTEEKIDRRHTENLKPMIEEINRGESILKDSAEKLGSSVKDIERVIAELRRAMRLDEIITALDKSLNIFSEEQKKTIGLFQKSLSMNLETLQRSVSAYQQTCEKNNKDLETMLKELNSALVNINKNQTYISQELNRNLEKVSSSFNNTTSSAMDEIKSLVSSYQKATDEMSDFLDDTKSTNVSLLKVSEEIKTSILSLNTSLVKFITSQEYKEKKLNRNIYIIIGIAALIGLLLTLSLFIK